jgi:hypothetical protein
MDSLFNINWYLFAGRRLPRLLRISFWVQLLAWLLGGLEPVRARLASLWMFSSREILKNSQTVVLEKIINDTLGTAGIYITNVYRVERKNFIYLRGEVSVNPIIYLRDETNPAPIYLDFLSEAIGKVDFIVWVPTPDQLIASKVQIQAIVDPLKLAGKTYEIKFIGVDSNIINVPTE